MLAQVATAGLIATNANVTATMDAGGIDGNPALYLYVNGYIGSLASINVGSTTSNNEFHVTGGSVCTVTGTSNIGNTGSLGKNEVRVSGAGSKMTISTLYVGNLSYDNAVVVESGGTLVATGNHYLGIAAGGARNSMLFDGGSYTGASIRIYMTGTCSNFFTVVNGGWVYLRGVYAGYNASYGNTAWFEGVGTRIVTTQGIFIGSDSTVNPPSSNNTVTVASGALAQTDYATVHNAYCLKTGSAPGNYLRLAGGFAASKARPDYVLASRIQVWNAADRVWEAGVIDENYTLTQYATEQLAFDATGYSGLANYYIFAGGDDYTPPPESVTVLILR